MSDPNGTELGVVNVVITDPGQGYLPNTTETTLEVMTDDDGNEMVDENGNPLTTSNYKRDITRSKRKL